MCWGCEVWAEKGMENFCSPSPTASACFCSAQPQSHHRDLPVLRISTQTGSTANEFRKGHSGGARDMCVCSGSTGAFLNPLSCGWRVVGRTRWAQSVQVPAAKWLWSAPGGAFYLLRSEKFPVTGHLFRFCPKGFLLKWRAEAAGC